ncbi:MAG: hypothetical protein DWQ01_19495 [Planctomycetota bacterium]|nr:MAG: hypothetical protein DWQ01_19495 [Planctomycetota bacterium]
MPESAGGLDGPPETQPRSGPSPFWVKGSGKISAETGVRVATRMRSESAPVSFLVGGKPCP